MSVNFLTRTALAGALVVSLAGIGFGGPPSIAGFGNGDFKVNGTASILDGTLTLTTAGFNQRGSAFNNAKQDITVFTTQFIFQATGGTNPRADGVAFVIENDPAGTSALSTLDGGSSLGYQGISPSVALELNTFNFGSPGINVRTNGAVGTYFSTAPVVLGSGDPIQVMVSYDGTNMTVGLLDTVTSATFSKSFAVDIPGTVGSPFDWVGFTGSTGSLDSVQTISTFSYSPFWESFLFYYFFAS